MSCKTAPENGQQYYSLIVSGRSLADFNGDGTVDSEDFVGIAECWLLDEPLIDIAPAGGDGIVNFLDFAKFAQSWNP